VNEVFLACRIVVFQKFDRNPPLRQLVIGKPNVPESTAAEPFDDSVGVQLGADFNVHGSDLSSGWI
jgi:hypothetical protein